MLAALLLAFSALSSPIDPNNDRLLPINANNASFNTSIRNLIFDTDADEAEEKASVRSLANRLWRPSFEKVSPSHLNIASFLSNESNSDHGNNHNTTTSIADQAGILLNVSSVDALEQTMLRLMDTYVPIDPKYCELCDAIENDMQSCFSNENNPNATLDAVSSTMTRWLAFCRVGLAHVLDSASALDCMRSSHDSKLNSANDQNTQNSQSCALSYDRCLKDSRFYRFFKLFRSNPASVSNDSSIQPHLAKRSMSYVFFWETVLADGGLHILLASSILLTIFIIIELFLLHWSKKQRREGWLSIEGFERWQPGAPFPSCNTPYVYQSPSCLPLHPFSKDPLPGTCLGDDVPYTSSQCRFWWTGGAEVCSFGMGCRALCVGISESDCHSGQKTMSIKYGSDGKAFASS